MAREDGGDTSPVAPASSRASACVRPKPLAAPDTSITLSARLNSGSRFALPRAGAFSANVRVFLSPEGENCRYRPRRDLSQGDEAAMMRLADEKSLASWVTHTRCSLLIFRAALNNWRYMVPTGSESSLKSVGRDAIELLHQSTRART